MHHHLWVTFSKCGRQNCNNAWYPFLPLGPIEDWDITKVDSTGQHVLRMLNLSVPNVVSGSRIPLELLANSKPAFISAATCLLSGDFAQTTPGQAWAEYCHLILLSFSKWNCGFDLKGWERGFYFDANGPWQHE